MRSIVDIDLCAAYFTARDQLITICTTTAPWALLVEGSTRPTGKGVTA